MEFRGVVENCASGYDGVNEASRSNINNKRAEAAPTHQHQQHSSTCSPPSTTSSSWSVRSKNELFPSNNITPESNNSSQKSYQFCRICHEGTSAHKSTNIIVVATNKCRSSPVLVGKWRSTLFIPPTFTLLEDFSFSTPYTHATDNSKY